MATAKRIYHTTDTNGARKLISAATSHQAVAHHAKSTIRVRVATQEDLVALTKAGVEVEDAGAEPGEASTPASKMVTMMMETPITKLRHPPANQLAALHDNIKAQAEAAGAEPSETSAAPVAKDASSVFDAVFGNILPFSLNGQTRQKPATPTTEGGAE